MISSSNSLLRYALGPIYASGTRLLSVLSWGANASHQCGIESGNIITRPTEVLELRSSDIKRLVAGKLTSAAITADGDVLTWGCGKAGKLGHGSGVTVPHPSLVHALWGRASIASVAMGEHHMLLLDGASGQLWACGENKEGQCGLGTTLEVIAAQHRQAYYQATQPGGSWGAAASGAGRASAGGRDGGGSSRFSKYLKSLMQQEPHAAEQEKLRMMLSLARTQQQAHLAAAHSLQNAHGGIGGAGPGAGGFAGGDDAFLGGGGAAGPGLSALGLPSLDASSSASVQVSGLQPGQLHTPTRLGRDLHPLASALTEADQPGRGRGGDSGGSSRTTPLGRSAAAAAAAEHDVRREQQSVSQDDNGEEDEHSLEHETVVDVDASRYFSVAATARGEVWTFGACYSGALGSDMSWSTSARRVTGRLAETLAANGGAVKVAAGGTFCLALTATGRVVVWGALPDAAGGTGGGSSSSGSSTSSPPAAAGSKRVDAGVVPGLPVIKEIAAGHQHALLSDGTTVWCIGRWTDASGNEVGAAAWDAPQQVLQLPEGVEQLAAGTHSCAAVSANGRLWVWGRLLDVHHAESLARRAAALHGGEPPALLLPPGINWSWAGFGGSRPRMVPGLSAVRGVALGGWHALALVD